MNMANSHSGLQRMLRGYAVLLTVLAALFSSLAQGQQYLDVKLLNGASTWEWHPLIIDLGNGNFMVNNVTYNPSGASVYCHDMTVGFDPFISASVDVVNNTATTQIYTLIFTLPISPIVGGTRMGGSTQGGVTDAGGGAGGAPDGIGTVSTTGAGTALYNGQIDGVDKLALFPDVKTINAPFAGGSASDSANAGLPAVSIPGPASALSTIGIKHTFSLTSGDRATFTSFFRVEAAVPEPGSVGLLAIGGLVLFLRRRR